MDKHVERLDRKKVWEGAIIDVYQDQVRLPDGKIENWDFVAHRKGAAAVVAVHENGKLLMVRQYRPALDRFTLELPAGARDSVTEDTRICAERELVEETGYIPQKLEKIMSLKTTVAFCNEFIDVYLAEGLKKQTDQKLDEAESIDIEEWDLEDLKKLIFDGTIQDSKTVSGILAYNEILMKRKQK